MTGPLIAILAGFAILALGVMLQRFVSDDEPRDDGVSIDLDVG